jgi:hypothetical protein
MIRIEARCKKRASKVKQAKEESENSEESESKIQSYRGSSLEAAAE